MKARNILSVIAGALILPAYLASCGEDRWAAYAEQTASDRWIDDTMRVWYYWADQLPHGDELNYFQEPFTFFKSLLVADDKFSSIDSLKTTTRSIPYTNYSYGFQFATAQVPESDEALYAQVLYVAANSPAAEIGLQRGEWILAMNGQPITRDNINLLFGSTAMQITTGRYDATNGTFVADKDPRNLPSARAIDDNPVYYKNVYERNGKRIGYLVYNHFSSGLTAGDQSYNQQLREAFRYFATQQVSEFVLDLRYNNGGEVSCAELLCSLLAPASALGQPLGYLQFGIKHQPQQVPLTMNQQLIGDGANLNLQTLHILTSEQTASASELLINCLKPYMKVVLIGSRTVGKNMGARSFDNVEQQLTMTPMICKLYNSKDETYETGFEADYPLTEHSDLTRFLPFGNPDELMLYTALGIIDGTYPGEGGNEGEGEGGNEETETPTLTHPAYSIARRANKAVIVK